MIHPERGHLALLPSSQPAARRVLLDVERTLRGRPPIRPIVCAQAVCCEEAALVRLDLCVVSDDLALDRIARRSRGSERERTEQQERCAVHGPHLTGRPPCEPASSTERKRRVAIYTIVSKSARVRIIQSPIRRFVGP